MDNQQEQEKTNTREHALETYNKYAQTRAAVGLAKTLGRYATKTAARGALVVAGATAEVWIPIVLTIVVVVFATFLIIQLGGVPEAPPQPSLLVPTISPAPGITSGN